MKFYGLVKNKIILFGLSIQLAALTFLPFIQAADAATYDAGGFIIQADRVVGENMKAMIISGETAGEKAKPMLRITYDTAEIYGMKLTKQFQTPGGIVSITMKANGPVRINGMQVDTSAVSFKGACVHAAKLVPNAALEDVTMVAHSMKAANSSLEQLQLQTVNGDGGVQKPNQLKILQDLGSMPFEQMKKEISKITSGQLPLTCDGSLGGSDLIGGIGDGSDLLKEPLPDVLDKVGDPLEDVIGNLTNPVKETVDQVLDPVKETIGKVTDPVNDVANPIIGEVNKRSGQLKETVRKTTDTAGKATQQVVEPVKPAIKTACEKLDDADGQITKELGLELIDQALEENKSLEELCPGNAELTEQLKRWNDGLLDSLGLISLLGTQPSEEEQLEKMREAILKEPDGKVIPF